MQTQVEGSSTTKNNNQAISFDEGTRDNLEDEQNSAYNSVEPKKMNRKRLIKNGGTISGSRGSRHAEGSGGAEDVNEEETMFG